MEEELSSGMVAKLIAQIQQTDKVVLGSLGETTALMHANM
jgi:hypothetical protein